MHSVLIENSVLNVKALVDIVNQKKALVASRGLLRDCEIFGNLRIAFVLSSSRDLVIVNVVKINFMIILGMTLLINLPLIIQTPMGKFSENSPPSDQTFPNKNFFKQRRSALLENLDLQWEKITIILTQRAEKYVHYKYLP